MDRKFSPRLRARVNRFGDGAICRKAAHDLDQWQHRRRIEEVHAGDALRILQARRERGDRQRRRVGRQNRFRRDNDFELAQQRAFGLQILDDRFDDEPRVCAIGERVDGGDSVYGAARGVERNPALRGERIKRRADRLPRFFGGAEPRIEKLHRMAGLRGDLRDARSHRAGADHGDGRVPRERSPHAITCP